jgi:molecular chaperone GrpE
MSSVQDDSSDAGTSRDRQSDESIEQLLESADLPQAVRAAVEAALTRAREAEDKMLRAVAETENQRKRMAKETAERIRFGNEKLLQEMLGVYDSLELSLRHAADGGAAIKSLREGVELTLSQFKQALQNAGVEPISAERGTPFDPRIHEAVMQEEADDLPDRAIVKTLQTGFMYNDRVLRAAKVVVAKERGSA